MINWGSGVANLIIIILINSYVRYIARWISKESARPRLGKQLEEFIKRMNRLLFLSQMLLYMRIGFGLAACYWFAQWLVVDKMKF